ncbi:UNVERIFIED_CONTAM: hypothetical protein FKN15_053840 [Acipenser sinensis]
MFLLSIEPTELCYQVRLAALATLDEAIDCATTTEAVFLDQPAAHHPTSRPIAWIQLDTDGDRKPYPAKVRSASQGSSITVIRADIIHQACTNWTSQVTDTLVQAPHCELAPIEARGHLETDDAGCRYSHEVGPRMRKKRAEALE